MVALVNLSRIPVVNAKTAYLNMTQGWFPCYLRKPRLQISLWKPFKTYSIFLRSNFFLDFHFLSFTLASLAWVILCLILSKVSSVGPSGIYALFKITSFSFAKASSRFLCWCRNLSDVMINSPSLLIEFFS